MKKHLLLTFVALFSFCMGAWAETYSGNCGQTKSSYVTWNLDTETGVLRISGTNDGVIKNYHTKNRKFN